METGHSAPDALRHIRLLEFREQLLAEELERYERMLNGEDARLLPFLRDAAGAYSETKTRELVMKLTDAAQRFAEYLDAKRRAEGAPPDPDGPAFLPEERTLVENYFYCALRVIESDVLRDMRGEDVSGATQTFYDLVRYARQEYEDGEHLYAAEADAEAFRTNYAQMAGLCRPASLLFHLFTGNFLTDAYPPGTQREYFSFLSPELQDVLTRTGLSPAEYGKTFEEMPDTLCGEACFPDEAARLRAEFAGQDAFVQRYLAFKRLRYPPSDAMPWTCQDDGERRALRVWETAEGLEGLVRGAVRLFTSEAGLSGLMNDDVYFTAGALLRQANRRLRALDAGRTDNG